MYVSFMDSLVYCDYFLCASFLYGVFARLDRSSRVSCNLIFLTSLVPLVRCLSFLVNSLERRLCRDCFD